MKVKNFAGFMKAKRVNENFDFEGGANPEEEMELGLEGEEEEGEELEGMEGEEEEEEVPTLEDLKAMLDDLTARVSALEGGEEGLEDEEELEGEELEGEEGAEEEEEEEAE